MHDIASWIILVSISGIIGLVGGIAGACYFHHCILPRTLDDFLER